MTHSPSLPERIDALERAAELSVDRLPLTAVNETRAVLARSRERMRHGTEWTVVALAGATGSGKSSLFNLLAGAELSASGVRRPTTSAAHAVVWGGGPDGESDEGLFEWLDLSRIHRLDNADPDVNGLVLLDLPDHDSVQVANRIEMERLTALVDLLVWVVDPEKYADAALHTRLARSLNKHGGAMLFALNQIDRLDDPGQASCHQDLTRLLNDYGLSQVPVISTSAKNGTGVQELRAAIVERVHTKKAALVRLQADAQMAAEDLQEAGGGPGKASSMGRRGRGRLVSALSDAAGVSTVLEAVAAGYRRDAGAKVGWPVTRWLAGLRSHPLRRLGLGKGRTAAATSLPRPGQTQLSALRQSLREVVAETTKNLPEPWPTAARRAVVGAPDRLVDPLDQAMAGVVVGGTQGPFWWKALGGLQTGLLTVAGAGGLWLLVLFGFSYLRLPEPPTPEWQGIPAPTLMALGGIAAGLILGMVGRGMAWLGGKRATSKVQKELETKIEKVAEDHVIAPLEIELDAFKEFNAALSIAGAGS